MAVNDTSPQGPGFFEWVKDHAVIVTVFGVIAVLLIAAQFMKKGTSSNPVTAGGAGGTTQDLSGLSVDQNGNHVVYVPTSTTFTTTNTITGSDVNSPTTTVNAPTTVSAPNSQVIVASNPSQVVN